jgi:hypothetical protein
MDHSPTNVAIRDRHHRQKSDDEMITSV